MVAVVWPPAPPAPPAAPAVPPAARCRSNVAWLTPAGTVQVSSTPTGQVTVAVVPINVGDEQGVLVVNANVGAAAASNPIPTAITAAAAKATMRAQPWTRTSPTELFEGNPSRDRWDDEVDAGDATDTRPTRTGSARPIALHTKRRRTTPANPDKPTLRTLGPISASSLLGTLDRRHGKAPNPSQPPRSGVGFSPNPTAGVRESQHGQACHRAPRPSRSRLLAFS